MRIIPAIDLKNGNVVRLLRGEYDKETIYGNDPIAFAQEFEKEGAEWLHVVDLDGALEGQCRNLHLVKKIRQQTALKIEFGGGIRFMEDIAKVIQIGVERVILGTKGIDAGFLKNVLTKYPDKIAVSVDGKDGIVQIQGWSQSAGQPLDRFISSIRNLKLTAIIYTNITRDGTLSGPDLEGIRQVLNAAYPTKIILSGGVASLEDIRMLARIKAENFDGVIVGRALYENKFPLHEALRMARIS